MTTRRIGILGGTFDPIHWGHLEAALAAEAALNLMRVYVVPSNVPPHRGQPFASSYHRFAMASLAVAGRTGWRASDLELRHNSRSYTAETLKQLHARGYAAPELFFIIGADAFADIATWMDYPAILNSCHFIVVSRPGFPVDDLPQRLPTLGKRMSRLPLEDGVHRDPLIILLDAPTADVSSTAIRDRCARNESIAGLLPDNVRQHIEQHGLYTSRSPERRGSVAFSNPSAGRLHGED